MGTTTTTPAPPTPPPTPLAPPTPSPPVTGPVQVYVMMGQSNMLGEGKVEGWTEGTLEYATRVKGLYPYLVDEKTNTWSQVDHVRDVAVMGAGVADGTVGSVHHNEWMSVNPTKKSTIGPELGIGFALAIEHWAGTCFHQAQHSGIMTMATARCPLLPGMVTPPASGTREQSQCQLVGMQVSSMMVM